MTSKQRATLRSIASNIEPIFQIGKDNIGDNMIKSMDEALERRELIKISVLKGSDYTAKELIGELARSLRAEEVCAIGNRVVLYRYSHAKNVKHIEF